MEAAAYYNTRAIAAGILLLLRSIGRSEGRRGGMRACHNRLMLSADATGWSSYVSASCAASAYTVFNINRE